jgi:hypothetical protein
VLARIAVTRCARSRLHQMKIPSRIELFDAEPIPRYESLPYVAFEADSKLPRTYRSAFDGIPLDFCTY